MEGLEITIYKKSDILFDNEEFRLDAEYYQKQYLELYSYLNNSVILSGITEMSDLSSNASFATVSGIVHDNNPKIIPFIRSGNVGETFINETDLELISSEAHYQLEKSITKLHDVMMARKGKIGGASIILEDQVNFNCNENVIKLTIKNKEEINPFYFTVYFNSKYGRKQVERLATGNVQPWVSIFQIRKLKFRNASTEFSKLIEETIINSYSKLISGKNKMSDSNAELSKLFGVDNWVPTNKNIAIKKISQTFLSTGRLDAEYYQPKYDELTKKINMVKHDTLGNLCTFKKSIEPGSDAYQTEGIPFVRVSDISKFGISETEIHLNRNEFDLDELKPKKDTILLSKDGSVGIAYKVEEDLDVITSSALLHLKLKSKEVLPDYLTLVLNSKLTQMQAERDAGGSIIQHWRPDEIKQVLIPILPIDVQKELAKQIQQSFKLRKESKHLLEVAKTAVEMAIEEGEDKAIKFIKANS